MPDISTLIQDVQSATEGKYGPISDELMDWYLEGCRNLAYLQTAEPKPRKYIGVSAAGQPDWKLWHTFNDPDSFRKLTAQTRMMFNIGHVQELQVLMLAKHSGHEVITCDESLEGFGVKGHFDAIIDGQLVDVKTTSPYGYSKFEKSTILQSDPYGYIKQLAGYAAFTGHKDGYFWAIQKSTAEMCLTYIPEEYMWEGEQNLTYKANMVRGPKPTKMCWEDDKADVHYRPVEKDNGNVEIPKGCQFCERNHVCHADVRAFKYANNTQYLMKVKSKPRVPELFGEDKWK